MPVSDFVRIWRDKLFCCDNRRSRCCARLSSAVGGSSGNFSEYTPVQPSFPTSPSKRPANAVVCTSSGGQNALPATPELLTEEDKGPASCSGFCYDRASSEVCVDGGHCVGSAAGFDVVDDCGDPDWFFGSLQKWSFVPGPTMLVYAKRAEKMVAMAQYPDSNTPTSTLRTRAPASARQPEVALGGAKRRANFFVVPRAMEFQQSWRGENGEGAAEVCHGELLRARNILIKWWGTEDAYFASGVPFGAVLVFILPQWGN